MRGSSHKTEHQAYESLRITLYAVNSTCGQELMWPESLLFKVTLSSLLTYDESDRTAIRSVLHVMGLSWQPSAEAEQEKEKRAIAVVPFWL